MGRVQERPILGGPVHVEVPRPAGDISDPRRRSGIPRLDRSAVHPVGPVLPVVALVVRLRPDLQVPGIHTQPVVAAVADDAVP